MLIYKKNIYSNFIFEKKKYSLRTLLDNWIKIG